MKKHSIVLHQNESHSTYSSFSPQLQYLLGRCIVRSNKERYLTFYPPFQRCQRNSIRIFFVTVFRKKEAIKFLPLPHNKFIPPPQLPPFLGCLPYSSNLFSFFLPICPFPFPSFSPVRRPYYMSNDFFHHLFYVGRRSVHPFLILILIFLFFPSGIFSPPASVYSLPFLSSSRSRSPISYAYAQHTAPIYGERDWVAVKVESSSQKVVSSPR